MNRLISTSFLHENCSWQTGRSGMRWQRLDRKFPLFTLKTMLICTLAVQKTFSHKSAHDIAIAIPLILSIHCRRKTRNRAHEFAFRQVLEDAEPRAGDTRDVGP